MACILRTREFEIAKRQFEATPVRMRRGHHPGPLLRLRIRWQEPGKTLNLKIWHRLAAAVGSVD